MEKLIIILSMLFLVSCGQENIANTISELEENFGEVRVVIVDEATPEDQETPYYHEVADDQIESSDLSENDEISTEKETSPTIEEGEESNDQENQDSEGPTEQDETTNTPNLIKQTATIYKTKNGSFKIVNESNNQFFYSSISSEAKSEINSWVFPNDSFSVEITYNPISKIELNTISILEGHNLGHILEINIIEEVDNFERTTPSKASAYCGLIYIDQTPFVQGTEPIYVSNVEDGRTYRVFSQGLTGNLPQVSSSMLAHYELLLALQDLEGESTSGCIYTYDDYYFNYELPEYKRIIDVESFNIGW